VVIQSLPQCVTIGKVNQRGCGTTIALQRSLLGQIATCGLLEADDDPHALQQGRPINGALPGNRRSMTSNLRSKADRRKKTITDAEAMSIVGRAQEISRAEIARKAYELYCARGGQNGSEVDDWLRAERELLNAVVEPQKRSTRKTATID
jgi:hypothetical protein